MNQKRISNLEAKANAMQIYNKYSPEERCSFDIIRTVTDLGYTIIFRPTDDLLGATIEVEDEYRGILITSQRSLPIQRFTLAHELGHLILNHKMWFDPLISNEDLSSHNFSAYPEEEAANTFASELLAPRKLIFSIAKSQGWRLKDFSNPFVIYQLSLRLGLSFKATCWALERCSVISYEEAYKLATKTKVKEMKEYLTMGIEISDPWSDVWNITKNDGKRKLECGPNDLFAISVQDNSSSGYLWIVEDQEGEFEIMYKLYEEFTPLYGKNLSRTMFIKTRHEGKHTLRLKHMRPWNMETIDTFCISYTNYGKEPDGYPRFVKEMRIGDMHA
jgi:Zn-dependent peptidase ImmA (M78 family)